MKKRKNVLQILHLIGMVGWMLMMLQGGDAAVLDQNGHPSKTLLQIFRHFRLLLKSSPGFPPLEINRILDSQTTPSTISLENLNHLAQGAFLRPANLERDQLAYSLFNEQIVPYDTPEIRTLFKELGDIEAVYPSHKPFRYILLNGATVPTMRLRLQELIHLVTSGKLPLPDGVQIVFLTGERDLFESETRGVLLNPAPLPQNSQWSPPPSHQLPQTEYQAAQWIWAQTDLPPILRNTSIVFVNAPKKEGRRPDTLGTVEAWIQTNPEPGHCLSVSNQPFVFYQELTTRMIFQKTGLDRRGFTVEGVGGAASHDVLLSLLLDNLARTLFLTLQEKKLQEKK